MIDDTKYTEGSCAVNEFVPWYDSRSGIEASLSDYKALMLLSRARHAAGYDRRERLKEWFVLGRFHLDSCGNFGILSEGARPAAPNVICSDDPMSRSWFSRWSASFLRMPEADIVCPRCRRGWDIQTCTDFIIADVSYVLDLTPHIGQTLGYVNNLLQYVNNLLQGENIKAQRIGSERSLQNDRYIDMTPDPKWPDLPINSTGWIAPPDGLEHVIEAGDKAHIAAVSWEHKECHKKTITNEVRVQFVKVFTAAGFGFVEPRQIQNEYCRCEYCAPWFAVSTQHGIIKVGWRKRVINLDYSGLKVDVPDELFKLEDCTKWHGGIHAWGYDKLTEYLTAINRFLEQPRK